MALTAAASAWAWWKSCRPKRGMPRMPFLWILLHKSGRNRAPGICYSLILYFPAKGIVRRLQITTNGYENLLRVIVEKPDKSVFSELNNIAVAVSLNHNR